MACHTQKKFDLIFSFSLVLITITYFSYIFFATKLLYNPVLFSFTSSVFQIINTMFWGICFGLIFVGILNKIPREFVISILGVEKGFKGIARAAIAGILLDLCSHGVLFVAMKLYERGASLPQVMAFLIASPWNSMAFTLILWSLVGFSWMMIFLLISLLIAIITGLIFEYLIAKNKLPQNPNRTNIAKDFEFLKEAKNGLKNTKLDFKFFYGVIADGIKGGKMVLKWILFGVILASLIRSYINPDLFKSLFGPTIAGLFITLLFATILEICSEGSLPIAADLLTRAQAPGGSFTFLMAGVSTDYTEIMSLKETTKSWKISLFLPLVTVPQILVVGYILNIVK